MRIKIFPFVPETTDDIFARISSRKDFPCEPGPTFVVRFEPCDVLGHPFFKLTPPAAFRYVKEDLSHSHISRIRGLRLCATGWVLQAERYRE